MMTSRTARSSSIGAGLVERQFELVVVRAPALAGSGSTGICTRLTGAVAPFVGSNS